jgi:hypothetical protein
MLSTILKYPAWFILANITVNIDKNIYIPNFIYLIARQEILLRHPPKLFESFCTQ